MNRQKSLFWQLAIEMALIAVVGTSVTLGAVIAEYHFSFSDLDYRYAFGAAMQEVLDHVVLPVLVLAVPMAAAGLWVLHRAFKPLALAVRQIEAVKGRERGYRLKMEVLPNELSPFIEAINGLLQRLDESAIQHEAFAADVAHEIRGPLSILNLELERLDHPTASRLKADVASMRRLVDQLMLLAQIDAATIAQIAPEKVRLAEVASATVASLAPMALRSDVALELEGGENAIEVNGRREAIAAALRNLIENAVRVSPKGGTVRVTVGPGETISVQDGGTGLSSEKLQALVHRYARADHASLNGAGLGLSIVSRIMEGHGGSLITNEKARELSLQFPNAIAKS